MAATLEVSAIAGQAAAPAGTAAVDAQQKTAMLKLVDTKLPAPDGL